MDADSEGFPAIAVLGVDAIPTVILDGVVGYLDALGGLEKDTGPAPKV
jgi:hypothetical protein